MNSYNLNIVYDSYRNNIQSYIFLTTDIETIALQVSIDLNICLEKIHDELIFITIDDNGFLCKDGKKFTHKKLITKLPVKDDYKSYFDFFTRNLKKKYDYVKPLIYDFCIFALNDNYNYVFPGCDDVEIIVKPKW